MIYAIISGLFAVASGVLCLMAQRARRDTLELYKLLKGE